MQRLTRPGWPGNLLAVVAGAITTLALAPFDLWPLALLSIALFYLGLRDLNPRQAAWRGWVSNQTTERQPSRVRPKLQD